MSAYSFQDIDSEKYEKILARKSVGFYEISFAAERLIAVDDVACQLSGYSREELLSISPLTLFDDDSVGSFSERLFTRALNERFPETVRYHVKTKSGEYVSMVAYPIEFKYREGEDDPESVVVAFAAISNK